MKSVESIFKPLYTAIPVKIRYPFDIATASLQDTLQNWRMPAYYVRTSLHDGQGEGTILYLGERPQYKSWIYHFFGQTPEASPLGEVTLCQILQGVDSTLSADITLCPLNPLTLPLFAHYGWRITPLYVNCHVDLSKPIEDLFRSKAVKEDMRIARRLGYRFDFLKDDSDIDEFFYQMLIPTTKFRHEERAFFSKLEDIKYILLHDGVLIGAYLEDQWVGAMLLACEDTETIRLANMGWREGDDQWRKKGLVAALFNQSFAWARENGYRRVNLGSSIPFANDGPLNFKLKWGSTLSAPGLAYSGGNLAGIRSFIGVKLNLASTATQHFLNSTPLLEYTNGKFRAIGWNADIPPLFRRQIDLGVEWINLAEIHESNIFT